MTTTIPHPIPYQGSKRALAAKICTLFPDRIETLYEPFAGSAAISIYAAHHNLAKEFVIADSLPELIGLWKEIIDNPTRTANRYEEIWSGNQERSPTYFNEVRERFNSERDPVDLLYLIVRCVKNAVRFNRHGHFTQSSDKRRLGTNPKKMGASIHSVSDLLKGRTKLLCGDFIKTIEGAGSNDLVYMDPPYHGTTYGRDKRYFAQLEREKLIEGLDDLNSRNIPFLLSYDGMTGETVYGDPLPDSLSMRRLLIEAGRSSQATLNGKNSTTFESLYVSENIKDRIEKGWSEESYNIEKMYAAA
ncbi:Dam family site-specific DNA-(adenine-N6)-methyltransferase [Aeromonas salmonicida]|uniref:Dam family site-specific DNA-(adenine-N6)-methyltransferase n=1 Tax=Aeromonas salmonicida TaxID=645 RepID=UPI001F4710FD|nr:DNA adenine methylase [Aeromonas salmonicida]MCE9932668.1 DNA adenine methylase [Aeromonas salmonicida]